MQERLPGPDEPQRAAPETPAGPILVGVDDSPEARTAAAYAAGLAGSSGRTLLLAHAYPKPKGPMDLAGRGIVGHLEAAARDLVDRLAAELRQTCSAQIETVIAAEKPVPFLDRLAGRASMVVVGQDTATLFDRMMFGSVAAHLAETARCPVVIVPESWAPSSLTEHRVVALSGEHSGQATLPTAIAEARRLGTGVLAVDVVHHAIPYAEVEQHELALAARVAEAQQVDPGVTVETCILHGHPDNELVLESAIAAAAVVGRPHRHGATGWKRSIAHAVAKRTHCPLIIVPAD